MEATMDFNALRQTAKQFTDTLQKCVKDATTEEDFDELCDVVEDVMCKLPDELIQLDYYLRTSLRGFLYEEYQQDTQKVNEFMNMVADNDSFDNIFSFNCEINDILMEYAKEFDEKIKGGKNGN